VCGPRLLHLDLSQHNPKVVLAVHPFSVFRSALDDTQVPTQHAEQLKTTSQENAETFALLQLNKWISQCCNTMLNTTDIVVRIDHEFLLRFEERLPKNFATPSTTE
jgi:hypothetical protein